MGDGVKIEDGNSQGDSSNENANSNDSDESQNSNDDESSDSGDLQDGGDNQDDGNNPGGGGGNTWEPPSNFQVVIIGDSFTQGSESNPNGFRSPRGRLFNTLLKKYPGLDFVGPQWELPAVGGDPHHAGWGGAYIGPGGSANNIFDRLGLIFPTQNQPEVIILFMGYNSIYNEPDQVKWKYSQLVEKIESLRPNARLVLSTLSPERYNTEAQSTASNRGYRYLNEIVRELCSESNQRVLADTAPLGYQPQDYMDSIHLSQSGVDRLVPVLADAVIKALRTPPEL